MKSLIALFVLFVIACNAANFPSHIEIDFVDMLPVGLGYTKQLGFLLSSLNFGTIYRIASNGVATAAFQAGGLTHSTGIRVDSSRNRLLVVNNDNYPQGSSTASLYGFDLSTGVVDLKTVITGDLPLFAYGVAVDSNGNAYVTDSLSGRIFKITQGGIVSVFVSNAIFLPPFDSRVGLTGIECFSNFLLAAVTGSSQTSFLYKIPLNNPNDFTVVKIEKTLPGLSALHWDPSRNALFAIASLTQELYELVSSDNWNTVSIVWSDNVGYPNPTSVALTQDNVPFVVCQTNSSGPYDMVQMYPPFEFYSTSSFTSISMLVVVFVALLVAVL